MIINRGVRLHGRVIREYFTIGEQVHEDERDTVCKMSREMNWVFFYPRRRNQGNDDSRKA